MYQNDLNFNYLSYFAEMADDIIKQWTVFRYIGDIHW